MRTSYAIALGSNVRHPRHGNPKCVLLAAMAALDLPVITVSDIVHSRPLGPSRRTYANAAALIESDMTPPELLDHLKALETWFGRVRGGQRWRARVLDLDIVLWSGGMWADGQVSVPHPHFRTRRFVLGPLNQVAAEWRDPVTIRTVRQLKARLDRRRPAT